MNSSHSHATDPGQARLDYAGELVAVLTTDIAGITRGRGVGLPDLGSTLGRGVGWVPANLALTPFDAIAPDNPWGASGDLRLMPDAGSRFRVALPGATPLHGMMSDVTNLDGSPWLGCGRSFLRQALADLEQESGLRLIAAFEQEFQALGTGWPPAPCFSLAALRRADPFGPMVMAALREADLEPELFLAEYGRDQFEVTCRPTAGLAAADRAVIIREVVREIARLQGFRASFAPKTAPDGVGNGVHIHFSFQDAEGNPVAYDAARPGGLSAVAGSFAAGIMRQLPALVALTAPSPVSYLRLQPHHWSAAYTVFGAQNREAALRICPVPALPEVDPAAAYNLEYRPADATGSPYLALGAIVRAGLAGIREGLAPPPLVDVDPSTLDESEHRRLGIARLPGSLPEALAALAADAALAGWFHPDFLACYHAMKRQELHLTAGLAPEELCRRYVEIY
ncbi:MAG: glutamine synthetase family protein [Dongiaceae bacterium]